MNKSSKAFDILFKSLESYWLNPDPVALKIIFATMLSFEFDVDPIWLFLIAPPASLKTEFITGLENIETTYPLSTLTPNTFASGMRAKKGETNSLLNEIKSKVITFKDFTCLLSGRYDDLHAILGQLRDIYDGSFVKPFGSGVRVKWKGKLGFIAGVTPIIDEFSAISSSLGERFVQYRLPGVRDKDVAKMAILQSVRPSSYREEVKQSFYDFYHQFETPETLDQIPLLDEYVIKMASLCSFVVKARAGVSRDSYRKQVVYIPSPESPARLAKQFSILSRCLAIVNDNKEVTEKEYKIILKLAFDTIPQQRLLILNTLFKHGEGISSRKISLSTNYPTMTTTRYLEDMAAYGIISVDKSKVNNYSWSISEDTKESLMESLVDVTYPESYVEYIFKWFNGPKEEDNLPI